MLLADSFKETTTILADAYRAFHTFAQPRGSEFLRQETIKKKIDKLKANVQSMAKKALQSPPASQALENKVDQTKTVIEGMIGSVLQTLAGLNAASAFSLPIR